MLLINEDLVKTVFSFVGNEKFHCTTALAFRWYLYLYLYFYVVVVVLHFFPLYLYLSVCSLY